ncbi:MAG: EAL domain-containing protein [Polyangiaceae bacterium]
MVDSKAPSRAEAPVVLLADDDPTVRMLLGACLEDVGFRVVLAENGARAVELFRERHTDVVILDVLMPVVDGFHACRTIRGTASGAVVPVLMLTGLDDEASIDAAYEAGATDFATKSINYRVVAQRVRYLARAGRAIGDLQSALDEREAARVEVARMAYFDDLTGLPNRRQLTDQLKRTLAQCQRHGRVAAVLSLDLDWFKQVNDTLGRVAGDELLTQAASRLESIVRTEDLIARVECVGLQCTSQLPVARLCGDEFTLILSDLREPSDAGIVAERLILELSRPYQLSRGKVFSGATVGVATFPQDGADAESLLHAAETALHAGKREGRGGVRYYCASMQTAAQERLALERDLREAMHEQQLQLYYQPRVDGASGRIVGVEALLRWHHSTRGWVSPAVFVPVAEELGLMSDIGQRVLDLATAELKRLHEEGYRVHMSVNVSPLQLREDHAVDGLARTLERLGELAKFIELEVTESTLLQAGDEIAERVGRLRQHGSLLALDDFGTGYSSFACLKRFDFNVLKIDRSFVMDILQDHGTAEIVKAIVVMAKTLGLTVVAEGVETAAHAEKLAEMGCEELQGFHFARPMPPDELRTRLAQCAAFAGSAETKRRDSLSACSAH